MNFLVDSFSSEVHLHYEAAEIAAGCLFLGAAYMHLSIPDAPFRNDRGSKILSGLDLERIEQVGEEIGFNVQRERLKRLYKI